MRGEPCGGERRSLGGDMRAWWDRREDLVIFATVLGLLWLLAIFLHAFYLVELNRCVAVGSRPGCHLHAIIPI